VVILEFACACLEIGFSTSNAAPDRTENCEYGANNDQNNTNRRQDGNCSDNTNDDQDQAKNDHNAPPS
jgi:hypothetical protein